MAWQSLTAWLLSEAYPYLTKKTQYPTLSIHSCLTSVSITLPLRLLCFLHWRGSFFFCRVEFFAVDPVVPMLPGDSDREKKHNASSCFANPLSLCMSRKIPAGWTNLKHGESKVLKGIGLYTWIVSFFCSHYTVQSEFTTMIRSSKVVVLGYEPQSPGWKVLCWVHPTTPTSSWHWLFSLLVQRYLTLSTHYTSGACSEMSSEGHFMVGRERSCNGSENGLTRQCWQEKGVNADL